MQTRTSVFLLFLSAIHAGHSATREKRGAGAQVVPITDWERMDILNTHNDLRRLSGSSNMRYMSWDSQLAWIAEQYSMKCKFEHNPERKHTTLRSVGENIYATSARIAASDSKKAIAAWYDEITDFHYATRTCTPGKMCGHYTQVVWATSYKVGCAMTICDDISGVKWRGGGTLFICNYGTSGNVHYNGKLMPVFEKGNACSKCDDGDYCRKHLCANSARDFIDGPEEEQEEGEPSKDGGGGGSSGMIAAVVILCILMLLLLTYIVYRDRVKLTLRFSGVHKPAMNATRFSNQNTPTTSRLNTPRQSIAGNSLHGMHRLTAADIIHPIEKLKAAEKGQSASAPVTPQRSYTKGTNAPQRMPPAVPPPPLTRI